MKPNAAIYEAKPEPGLRASWMMCCRPATAARFWSIPAGNLLFGKEKHKAIPVAGHIPGAVNIPHSRAFTEDFRLRDKAALARDFSSAAGPAGTIAYCNTGHWAATDWFVLSEVLNQPGVKLYDGSMLEYSLEKKGPVERPAGSGS